MSLLIHFPIPLLSSPNFFLDSSLDSPPDFFPPHSSGCALSPEEQTRVQELLCSGYWAFECLTVRDFNDMICGICGIAPKLEIARRSTNSVLQLKNVEVKEYSLYYSPGKGQLYKTLDRASWRFEHGFIPLPEVHMAGVPGPRRGAGGGILAGDGERGPGAGTFSFQRLHHAL